MKGLYSNAGEFKYVEVAEPYCGTHDIKCKVIYSAVSAGTETNTSRNQKMSSILKKRDYWEKAQSLIKDKKYLTIVQKFKGLSKSYDSIGYSAIGKVLEIGRGCSSEVKVGDYVHLAGEYANHQEIVSVPQGMVFKVEGPNPLYALATICSIPLHAISHAIDAQPKPPSSCQALVLGGGIIGFFALLYLRELGVEASFHDPAKDVLSDAIAKRYDGEKKIDLMFFCTPNMQGITDYLENANDGVVVSVVGETELEAPRDLLEDKYATLRFCKSYGYGRGNKAYEFGISSEKELRFEHTVKKNITRSLDIIKNYKETFEKSDNLISFVSPNNFSISGNKINIIKWSEND